MRQALWITRFDWEDEAELTALVSRAIKVGITDLLMQVRGAGDALYRSEVAPASAKIAGRLGWPPKWDPLGVVCELAAAHDGVRVHAWVNALSGWPAGSLEVCAGLEPSQAGYPDHLLIRHPDAVLVDARGEPMPCPNDTDYVWVSARHVDVVRELQAATSELVNRYPLAGIHLDRIRYPTAGWFDPIDGTRDAKGITDLVAAVRDRAPAELDVSASLMPDYGSDTGGERDHIATYGQDGWAWVEQGLCTSVMPMVYTTIKPGESWDWATLVAEHIDALPDGTCWVALYAEHDPAMLRQQAEAYADRPIAGLAWYSARLIRENDRWSVLAEIISRLG
jgi:uncharacterized lipoprotein YddW (UPF0748 family)